MPKITQPRENLANNCRVLTEQELIFINAKYRFWFEGDFLCTTCVNRQRKTKHLKTEKFSINVRRVRKITYTVKAIQMFEKFQKDEKLKQHSLTDIQNTLNICRLTYQPMNEEQVLKVLNKENKR